MSDYKTRHEYTLAYIDSDTFFPVWVFNVDNSSIGFCLYVTVYQRRNFIIKLVDIGNGTKIPNDDFSKIADKGFKILSTKKDVEKLLDFLKLPANSGSTRGAFQNYSGLQK